MTDDSRIEHLLDELANSHATPEEVCAKCPELLGVVRDRWQQSRRLGADLDSLFSPPDKTGPYSPEEPALPQVSGYEIEAVLGRGGVVRRVGARPSEQPYWPHPRRPLHLGDHRTPDGGQARGVRPGTDLGVVVNRGGPGA